MHAELIDAVKTAGGPADYAAPLERVEDAFHGAFVRAYGNRQIEFTHAKIMRKMFLLRLMHDEPLTARRTLLAVTEHQAVIEAIATGDLETSREALRRHLQGVLHRLMIR